MEPSTEDPVLNDLMRILGQLLAAWVIFKGGHDLKSLDIVCCDKSRALFNALTEFERLTTGKEVRSWQKPSA